MAGNLALAYNTLIEICNRINPAPCLYSMDNSEASPINGFVRRMGGLFPSDPWLKNIGSPIQYFDCSGLMSWILWKGGYFPENPGFTTFTEELMLKQAGFTILPASVPWQNGDILWYNKGDQGHTEMVVDASKNITGGAGGRGSAWGLPPTRDPYQQVEIHTFDSRQWYPWQFLARDSSAGTISLKWIYKDEYLSEDETLNNATIAAMLLSQQGYSMEATCGILGNMAAESGVEPWLTERGGGGGYGLVQWTPKQNLIDAVNKSGLGDYTKGDTQVLVIDFECTTTDYDVRQWYPSDKTSFPFVPFPIWKVATNFSPEDMAEMFMWFYERPGVPRLEVRKEWARKFYEIFKNGLYNGAYAFNIGTADPRHRVLLLDYMRRKYNGLTP